VTRYIFFLCIIVGLASCVTKKKLTYLRKESAEYTTPAEPLSYHLRIGDNITVEVKSPDPAISNIYNLSTGETRGTMNDIYVYLKSHSINKLGEITIPLVGSIRVEGLTIDECSSIIEEAMTEHLQEVTVLVNLVSYRISVLGEVNDPGMHTAYQNRITIFEALGLAGDLTNYGNRKKIKVVREDEGIQKTYEINLTEYEVFNSEAYYIYPHDIIYVKPLAIRPLDINLRAVGILLSATALVVLVLRSVN